VEIAILADQGDNIARGRQAELSDPGEDLVRVRGRAAPTASSRMAISSP
jgi:hypothetical protein